MYKISLNFKYFDLNSQTQNYLVSILDFFSSHQIQYKRSPIKCKKITVLRSPHIDKKSREQFQICSHKRTLSFTLFDKNLVLVFLKILKSSKFLGVEFEILVEYSTF